MNLEDLKQALVEVFGALTGLQEVAGNLDQDEVVAEIEEATTHLVVAVQIILKKG